MNERMTRRDADGQAVMDCQKCKADWTGKHGKPMADCTALYCRNRLLDRLVEYEDTGLTPGDVEELIKMAASKTDKVLQLKEELQGSKNTAEQYAAINDTLYDSNMKLGADRKALINELCQYCGKYKHAHEGACDGCRWREK